MHNTRQEIEREAADWLILLAEDPDDQSTRNSFEEWLGRSSEHERVWQGMSRLGSGLQAIRPSENEETLTYETQCVPPRRRSLRRFAWVGGLALAASLAIALMPSFFLWLRSDSITKTAELKTIALEDRSEVVLAPESAFAAAFISEERTVDLVEGRAFFEVEPDAERPFVVRASGVRITVLGTAFEVEQDERSLSVAVTHGSVLVEGGEGSEFGFKEELGAGDRLVVDLDSSRMSRAPIEVDEVAEWREKRLTVHDRPVREVVDALRPFHSGRIVLDEDFEQKRVTGVYRLDDPLQTLRGIARAHDGSVRVVSPWLIFVGSGDS
ncbi:MAG: FecR domain-containing protein [Verrucomicrobiota bacterium]